MEDKEFFTTWVSRCLRKSKMQVYNKLQLLFRQKIFVYWVFNFLQNVEDEILLVIDYFGETYVISRVLLEAEDRCTITPRPLKLQNQHDATIADIHKTNNISNSWHNRFQIVTGKHHPVLYSAISELQKEQADSEIAVIEMNLGSRVQIAMKEKWADLQIRLQSIPVSSQEYKNDKELNFLCLIVYNVS